MKSVSTAMFRTALALSLGFAGLGSAQSLNTQSLGTQSTIASPPWGTADVREILEFKGCTVYGLVTDPEHTYWVVCAPGAAPLPSAATGH